MVARNEVHLALECLLDLSQDFVGLRKLLRLVMCLIILVTIRSVSSSCKRSKRTNGCKIAK